jgi:hypothetical protein
MKNAFDFPHLVSLVLIVAVSTLIAGLWADWRRNRIRPSPYENIFGQFIVAVVFMIIYVFVAFLLPALILTTVLWIILSSPDTVPDVVLGEATAQIAALISIGANFADVASTYGRVAFRKHIRQYLMFVIPTYFATMGLAWLGARALASKSHYQPAAIARAGRLFALPFLAPERGLNLLLIISAVFVVGAVSYLLRKRGENR